MREKNLVILCIIFAVLVSLVFLKKSIKPEIPTTEEITDVISPPINADNIIGLTLRLGDGTTVDEDQPKKVILTKKNGQWIDETLFGVNARDTVINPVLEKLDQLEGELRSNKENVLDDYGITDAKGVHIELARQGNEIIHVIVGTEQAGYQNNFVRMSGSNAVYVVNENLLGTLGARMSEDEEKLDVNKWADKRIGQIDVNQVVGVTISEFKETAETKIIDLKREMIDDKKQWRSMPEYDFGLSASKIKNMIEAFNSTYARDIIAADVEGVFDAPGWIGTFTLDNGKQVKFVRGSKDEDGSNYYVKREGVGYYFVVPESTFHSRVNQQGGIFASNPFKAEENSIEGIEVRDLASNKTFLASKKTVTPEASEGEETESDGEEAKEEIVWETASGEAVEKNTITKLINALKSFGLEIVSQPAMSLKDIMTIRLTKEGAVVEYKVSEVYKTDTNKECHFLSVGSSAQKYCVSKSPITSLQNALLK